MMITTPSAPGGAGAANTTLPGAVLGAAAAPAAPAGVAPDGASADAAEGAAALPPLFAQLLDFAGLAAPAGPAGATAAAGAPGSGTAAPATDGETAVDEAPADLTLAAMMPVLHFAMPPAAQAPAASTSAAASTIPSALLAAGHGARGAALPAGAADSVRQAAADAITAATTVAATPAATASLAAASPLAARLMQGLAPTAGEPAPRAGTDARQPSAATTGAAPGTATATATAALAGAIVQAAQDGAMPSGQDGQSGQPQGEGQGTFRGVMAAAAPLAGAAAPADTVQLAGNPDTWQQPLRAALGDRLQVSLQKGSDQAVIRLEPPNLGTIEISIRQSAGALHVSMSATHGEVVRQLNAVGDSMRQDLSQRQGGDVAVTVTQAPSRSLADGQGGGRQSERESGQREQRGPGRALTDGDDITTTTTFAMARE